MQLPIQHLLYNLITYPNDCHYHLELLLGFQLKAIIFHISLFQPTLVAVHQYICIHPHLMGVQMR